MSKARLIITAVVIEGRSQAQVARDYGVSKGWVSELLARYRPRVTPRSSHDHDDPTPAPTPHRPQGRPHRRTPPTTHRPGPRCRRRHHRLAPHHHHQLTVSRATIYRILAAPTWSSPNRRRNRRPPTSGSRPSNPTKPGRPTSPTTDSPMAPTSKSSPGSTTTPATPCSLRPPPRHRTDRRRPPSANRDTEHGIPVSTLTDNGMVYTTRFARRPRRPQRPRERTRPTRRPPEELPTQPPHHLRQSRTLPTDHEEWLRAQPQPPPLTELQTLLDTFVDDYNHRRPHRSLPHRATPPPPTRHARKPPPAATTTTTTHRVRPDRIDNPATSPCASTAACTTSASAEPTTEPTSSCSSTTSTSASSTPPPAKSSAQLTIDPEHRYHGTGQPHRRTQRPRKNQNDPNPMMQVRTVSGMSRDITWSGRRESNPHHQLGRLRF